ncbi:leishmanolysin-related zinc metalloendopeptidase [Amycolatopsis sp. Hca4]|uniref:leishmanolysin-related zinc metalloendopeptidase n=1 Tax=Amycolatopsis sp. Hca4 TaxID=2742131 RepID=UPI001591AA60|nr:leishmanolysin-related zinc metalloendopeptidase [Amycolatopsis sp. Hca4]QKV72689.1 peptidase [Amycolatopsis sp. Hca4]
MPEPKIYNARADASRARLLTGTESPFTITVEFAGGLSQAQEDAFAAAADRWATVIVGDLPDVVLDGVPIDDVLIVAQGADIDGVGHVLGQAHITHVRPAGPEAWALLPVRGEMTFDKADLARMEETGVLGDVITHEMGHVLGIGSLWGAKGLLVGKGTSDPSFAGPAAVAEYQKLRGAGEGVRVPVEDTGGPGTRDVHWRERVFGTELMTGFVGRAANPLSRLTVASLADLGYQVDVDAADAYELPAAAVRPGAGMAVHALAVTSAPVELSRVGLLG